MDLLPSPPQPIGQTGVLTEGNEALYWFLDRLAESCKWVKPVQNFNYELMM